MKLNLGCGDIKMQHYVNCDISQCVEPDMILDLEGRLPFKDNSVDEIQANHIFEHIDNFIPLMHEIYRICKNGTKVFIKTPFYSSWGQFNDPTHVRFFSPYTFKYFMKSGFSQEVGVKENMFVTNRVRLNFGVSHSSFANFIMNPLVNLNHKIYCRFFSWLLPVAEIKFELEVRK